MARKVVTSKSATGTVSHQVVASVESGDNATLPIDGTGTSTFTPQDKKPPAGPKSIMEYNMVHSRTDALDVTVATATTIGTSIATTLASFSACQSREQPDGRFM